MRSDNRRAQLATRKLQSTVRKVAKMCSTIVNRMTNLDIRTSALETDVGAEKGLTKTHAARLVDIQWKLENQENRQRQNNLRVLEVPEGKRGKDVRSFLMDLLQSAFPELHVGTDLVRSRGPIEP
ncbi:hypothetical protein NDU88_001165 [Pleurodeles waltl]|uniref:Uncharacterized protein n=1 Tax=Pleurodeles waltl TaxID=8319 RepID=A0AAV7R890_PLEWA|nr:hypothetical protein NDU88_001165 [Pleurodeles waltl]